MRRSHSILLFFIASLIFPAVAHAQAWSGIISPSRAVDWTQAGIARGLPDAGWTQCGSTIAAYNGSASTITTQLASCSVNQYIQLGAGTFTLSGQIKFPTTGHLALRGMGANSTFIVLSGTPSHCNQTSAMICAMSSDGTYTTQPPARIYNWTAGYAQGSNQVTLSSTSGISTNSTMLFLDQCDTGYSGASCSGSAVDNGQLFICGDKYNGTTGCSSNGPDGGGLRPERNQLEIATATAINGNVVTITPPLKMPNWASGQTPQAWIVQPIAQVGIENLAIDSAGVQTTLVEFGNAYNWWVSGVKFTNFYQWAVNAFQTANGIAQNNYCYHSTGPDSYCFRLSVSSNNLVQNNIIQQVFAPLVFDGASSGDVVAYNFVNLVSYPSDYMRAAFFSHAGNYFDLYEGNIGNEQYNDGNHGTASMITRFRNFFTGWESCANGQCGSSKKITSTNSLNDQYGSRYENNVANVLGTPGYHTAYQSVSSNVAVLTIGAGNGGASPAVPTDPLSKATSLLWGNYDVATNGVRFCGSISDTGWLTTCLSTLEVPLGLSILSNPVPTKGDTGAGQGALPASFYLSSKPAWFGSIPWPAIGPDVSGGSVGVCSGTLNAPGQFAGVPAMSNAQCRGTSLVAGWAGHVNANPAVNCYLSIMNGPPDGSGSVLAFDANACYASGSPPPPAPNPPTNLVVVVN